MAIKAQKSDVKAVGERKLYTGLAKFKVVAINPTQSEAEALGIRLNKEPKYTDQTETGEAKLRLDVYVTSVETPQPIKTKVTFWLEDKVRMNKDGDKTFWINAYGDTCCAASADDYDWFKKDGVREMKGGEDGLYDFLKAWLNIEREGEVVLDDFSKIAGGDVTELRELAAGFKDNTVKLLLGVSASENGDRFYQAVYDKCFQRPYLTNTEIWLKRLNNQYSRFDAEYQGSLALQEFSPEAVNVPDTESAGAENAAPAGGADDAPF